jgi:hypothetical protein
LEVTSVAFQQEFNFLVILHFPVLRQVLKEKQTFKIAEVNVPPWVDFIFKIKYLTPSAENSGGQLISKVSNKKNDH